MVCALALALVWPGGTARAEEVDFADRSLEELLSVKIPTVTSAARHEQSAVDAPALVTVVEREDIQQFGYRSLADILRSVRGMYVSYDEVYANIGIRGVSRPGDYGARALVMVNGHRLNEPVYSQAFGGNDFPLDVDLIQRVEVIRGPGSALYGNNAVFGVVNIITRDARSVNGLEVSSSLASEETWTGRATFGKEFTNGMSLLVSGSLSDSVGRDEIFYEDFADVNGGIAEGMDGERTAKLFASLNWGEFTLEGAYGDRRRDIPNGAYDTVFNVAPNYADDERGYLELRWEHEFDCDWTVNARGFYDEYQFSGLQPYAGASPADPPVFNQDSARARLLGGELQGVKAFSDQHRLTLGAEWNHTLKVVQQNYDISPYQLYSDVESDGNNWGLYVQDELELFRRVAINAGVRYDWYSSFGDTLNPRLAIIYGPWERTAFKAMYGQAFRAPNAFELGYVAPGYAANPELQPEKVESLELAWEQGLGRNYRFTASVFRNDLEDLIAQTVDGGTGDLFYDNISSARAQGFETELEAHWAGGVRARASYSLTEAVDEETDLRLSNSPRHVGKLQLALPLAGECLSAGLELQALSARRTEAGSEVPGFTVCNATLLSRELCPGLTLSFSVYNLFDKDYRDPVSPDYVQDAIWQAGRSFRLKLDYRF